MTLDPHAEALYGGDPATFVARRDALVRELRAAGQRQQATQVKALRRPTAPAAALNAVSRSAPDLIAAAVEAAEVLTRTQRRALSGLAGADVRGAVRAHHATIAAVIEAAGPQPVAVADAMRATLLAAAVDPAVEDHLRRGVLATAAAQADTSAALLLSAPLTAVGSPDPPAATADADAPDADADATEQGAPDDDAPDDGEADRARADAARAVAEAKAAREAAIARDAAVESRDAADRVLGQARAAQVVTARKRRTAVATAEASASEAVTAARTVERLREELARAEAAHTTAAAVQEEAESLLEASTDRDDAAGQDVQQAQRTLEEAETALAALPPAP